VNPWRIPGAFIANLRAGKRTQGSSTLTMQLVRQPGLFLTPEKTYERKIKEALLAFELEKTFTKEEIFTYYCNQVYFGHGNYGVEAASRVPVQQGDQGPDPSRGRAPGRAAPEPLPLSPVEHPERALQRRNHVIQRMLEEKYISAEEAKAALAEPLHLNLKREPPSIAPYFSRRSASTSRRNTGRSASTRAACACTRPSTPPPRSRPTSPCATGCA
jgi:penicillin-binding protein 1A